MTSARQIQSALSAAKFDPRKPGPMKIVADQGSPEFWLLRANEFIAEVRSDSKITEDTINKLNKAMGLLALVKVHYDGLLQSKRKPLKRAGIKNPGLDSKEAEAAGLVRESDARIDPASGIS